MDVTSDDAPGEGMRGAAYFRGDRPVMARSSRLVTLTAEKYIGYRPPEVSCHLCKSGVRRAAARAPLEKRLGEEQKCAEKSDSRKLAAEVKHGAGVDCEFVLSDFYRSTAISSRTQFCGPHR